MAETLRDLMYGAALRSQPMTQPPMLLPDTIQRLAMQQGGSIGAPQRSTLAQMLGNTGTAAQRLAAALDQYGARIPGTQARITLKDLTLGDAGQVMEDWSYGSPPTTGGNYATGGIGTMGVQPRAMDLLNLGGVAGGAVQAGKTGARVLGPTLREMASGGADNLARATGARFDMTPPIKPPAYQIEHRPMTDAGGAARLHDLTPAFGEDIYGKNALQFFGSGDPRERATLGVLSRLRGKPDEMVSIFRGVPDGAGAQINPGDWITLDRNVAADYGRVIEMKVPASHVTSWPDSLLEFGYFPPEK
jgi:hypothetical protein